LSWKVDVRRGVCKEAIISAGEMRAERSTAWSLDMLIDERLTYQFLRESGSRKRERGQRWDGGLGQGGKHVICL